jgi:hypothetical protein
MTRGGGPCSLFVNFITTSLFSDLDWDVRRPKQFRYVSSLKESNLFIREQFFFSNTTRNKKSDLNYSHLMQPQPKRLTLSLALNRRCGASRRRDGSPSRKLSTASSAKTTLVGGARTSPSTPISPSRREHHRESEIS